MGVDPGDVHARFALLSPHLNERLRRYVAAAEAHAAGRRGISVVSRATGVSRQAIRRGLAELQDTPTAA